jgi:hypothetical protein
VDREFPDHLWAPRSSELTPLDCLFCGFVKDNVCREEVQNVNETHDGIFRVAECVTNETFASTSRETEYHLHVCSATSGAHTKINWTHKKLCESQWWKMCRFLQCTLWLTVYKFYFFCHLRVDTLCIADIWKLNI